MIPIEQLRALVGSAADDASADARLVALEAYAVAQIELTTGAYLGAPVEAVSRVIGYGGFSLRLPRWPIQSVSSVAEASVYDLSRDPVPLTDYVVRSPFLIRTGDAFWYPTSEYTVTYVAGYALEDVPPIYVQAVRDIVVAKYGTDSAAAGGNLAAGELTEERFGDYSYKVATGSASSSSASVVRAVADILATLPRRLRV